MFPFSCFALFVIIQTTAYRCPDICSSLGDAEGEAAMEDGVVEVDEDPLSVSESESESRSLSE